MIKPRIQTMAELSKVLDISRPTLARFFEDEASVRPSTAAKINKGLAKVDYVYNFLATRQNRKSTGLIGVVIPYFEDLFYASLLDSIEIAAREAGFTIITQSSHGDLAAEERAIRKLRSLNVDGAIVAPLGTEGNYETFQAAGKDFHIVFADSYPSGPMPPADFVGTDNSGSIGVMVEYLCRTGASPAYLPMPNLNSNAVNRQDAYLRKMSQLGLTGEIIPTSDTMGLWQFERFGLAVMDDHFSHGRYVDATILCANDRIAFGAVRAANTHGLFARTGETRGDLRIAGHDDHPLSRYTFPALTTIAQDVAGIGQGAVDLLVNRVRSNAAGDAIRVLKDGTLKIRESA